MNEYNEDEGFDEEKFREVLEEYKDQDENNDWAKQFKEESLENVLKRDEIFPTLQPRLNAVYEATLLSNPKKIKTKHGEGYAVNIDYNGLKMNMYCPNSFLFNLEAQRQRKGLTFSELIGKKIVFQKAKGILDGREVNLMTVQIK